MLPELVRDNSVIVMSSAHQQSFRKSKHGYLLTRLISEQDPEAALFCVEKHCFLGGWSFLVCFYSHMSEGTGGSYRFGKLTEVCG